jgi:predicted ATPase
MFTRLEAYELAQFESVPLWASLLGVPTPDRFPPINLSPTRQREETFRVMREWLHRRAARKPVLFVVEDLHWVDASTLEFIGQFLEEARRSHRYPPTHLEDAHHIVLRLEGRLDDNLVAHGQLVVR